MKESERMKDNEEKRERGQGTNKPGPVLEVVPRVPECMKDLPTASSVPRRSPIQALTCLVAA